MRNFALALALLLAGTAFTPASAQRHDRDSSSQLDERRAERAEAHEDRVQARQERAEARQQMRAEGVERVERAARPDNVQHVDGNRDRPVFDGGNSAESGEAAAQVESRRAELRERLRERSRDSDGAQANVNERGRPVIRDDDTVRQRLSERRQRNDTQDMAQQRLDQQRQARRIRVPEGARPDRPAPLPQSAQHRDRRGDHHWRTDWRHDHRYDWRNHRRHHRSIFRLGFYFDPFGWGYHRYGIGWRLWPSYYSSNYWLNDPYQYRLPYAPYPYRWVRYYNDALLVDTFTGQVVDVIYDFFW
jgi:Ni/Co efflux regulator RcnB